MIVTDTEVRKHEIKSFAASKRAVKVQWQYKGKDFELSVDPRQNQLLLPYLLPNGKILVFFANHPRYPKPGNVVLFNEDATILKVPEFPCLLSEKYRALETFLGEAKAKESICFIQPHLKDGNLNMWIRFGYEGFFEIWEFDENTGEFGSYLGCTRL